MDTKNTCLVIVDTNAFLHAVIYRLKGLEPMTETVLKYNIAYLLSGAYLERLLVEQRTKNFQIILASDLKPYWRLHHLYIHHGVNYKASRGKDTQRNKLMMELKSLMQTYLVSKGKLPLHLYCSESLNGTPVGYEADDIAAGLVKLLSPNYKHTYLLTDDSDWLPLTNNAVTWCGIARYAPRIRTPKIILDWVKQHSNFSGDKSTKAKKAFLWSSHTDIWRFKAIYGDKADGITGDSDLNKYIHYIDLFNPVTAYRIWEEAMFLEKVQYCLFKGREALPMSKIRDTAKNIPLFMNEY
jgi:hypothetical protein